MLLNSKESSTVAKYKKFSRKKHGVVHMLSVKCIMAYPQGLLSSLEELPVLPDFSGEDHHFLLQPLDVHDLVKFFFFF